MFIPEDQGFPEDDTVQVLAFDSEDSPRTEKHREKSSLKWSKAWKNTITGVLLAAVFTPLVCAAIGACVDFILFGSSPRINLNFHTRYMAYSSLVVVPLVVVRIVASRMDSNSAPGSNRVVKIVDVCVYILLTIAVGVALPNAMLAGPETFHAADHTRNVLSANGMFEKIRSEEDVYNWLEEMMYNVYDDSFPSNKGSRAIDKHGRAILFCSLRLRQSRVKPTTCSEIMNEAGLVIGNTCYPPFSSEYEDNETYSNMKFTYYNEPHKKLNGKLSYPSDISAFTVNAGSFSLAGFWTWFSPDATRNDTVNQIRDMREANWIDQQTRLVGIDAAVAYPDFKPRAIWITVQMNVVVSSSGKFLPQPVFTTPNYFPLSEVSNSDDPNGEAYVNESRRGFTLLSETLAANSYYGWKWFSDQLGRPDIYFITGCSVIIGSLYLIPFYLGIFCAFIYTFQVHILLFIEDRRRYVRQFFTYTEIIWMLMLVLSWVFWCRASYEQTCQFSVFIQTPFPSATDSNGAFRTGVAIRMELQNVAVMWTQARNVLGFALFLHLLNFLKFFIKFKALGALIRTLSRAAPELLSFSVSFFVIFIAFVTMFFILFSVDAKEFMSYERSTMSLWLGMLGELEVTEALWRNHVWSLPMIVLFTFLSVFVLLTTVVAIVSNAHDKGQDHDDGTDGPVLHEHLLVRNAVSMLGERVRRSGQSKRIHPLLPEDTSGACDYSAKLRPVKEHLHKWAERARKRIAERSMYPAGNGSLPAARRRREDTASALFMQPDKVERDSTV